jgi:type IV pilus assembly protein PilN
MIKINLLAEGKRQVTRKAKLPALSAPRGDLGLWLLGAGVLLGILVSAGAWYYHYRIIQQKDRDIAVAQEEVRQLEAIIQEVEQYKAQKVALDHKIGVIKQLKANQRGPVRIMDQISRALPELLWLDQMDVAGSQVTVSGRAFNTNAVANFIENLDRVPEFQEPILRDTKRDASGQVYAFVIVFTFQLAPEVVPGQNSATDAAVTPTAGT